VLQKVEDQKPEHVEEPTDDRIIEYLGLSQFHHTKTLKLLHVVKLRKRVSSGEFSGLSSIAKGLGGYYSSYAKH